MILVSRPPPTLPDTKGSLPFPRLVYYRDHKEYAELTVDFKTDLSTLFWYSCSFSNVFPPFESLNSKPPGPPRRSLLKHWGFSVGHSCLLICVTELSLFLYRSRRRSTPHHPTTLPPYHPTTPHPTPRLTRIDIVDHFHTPTEAIRVSDPNGPIRTTNLNLTVSYVFISYQVTKAFSLSQNDPSDRHIETRSI